MLSFLCKAYVVWNVISNGEGGSLRLSGEALALQLCAAHNGTYEVNLLDVMSSADAGCS